MVEQIKYNPMFAPAMRQVFGRTLICRDMDKASHFAKNSNHDCVTLDGTLYTSVVCGPTSDSIITCHTVYTRGIDNT